MPDMYYSRAYDAYTENPNFADNQSSRLPVPGTIKRDEMLPYHIPDNDSGYAYAGNIKSPLVASDSVLAEGRRLFDIYCGICHGEKLDGNGPLYNGGGGPYVAAPANFISGPKSTLPAGTIFWVATYGIRNMGSYASQLNRYQRWMIVDYIKSVQHKDGVTQAQEDSTQRALVTAYHETLSTAK
jgi:mono/diheme cytochrome c family protein